MPCRRLSWLVVGWFLATNREAKKQMVILIILGLLDPEIFLCWQSLGDKSDWKHKGFPLYLPFPVTVTYFFCLFLPATKPWTAYYSFYPSGFLWDRLSFSAVVSRSDRPRCLGENKHCAVVQFPCSVEGLAQQQTWLLSASNELW